MNVLRAVALLLLAAPAARAQENVGAAKGRAGAGTLGGFDTNLTLWESSGVVTAPEAYSNTLSLIVEPRFAVGMRWLRGTWAEPLAVSARILLAAELAGNDPGYRTPYFDSPALLAGAPEQVPLVEATPRVVSGARRRLWYSDLWLNVSLPGVVTIPRVDVSVSANARVVLPTSLESRCSGLVAAPSLYAAFARKIWRLNFEYGLRAAKFFYRSSTADLCPIDGVIDVNGAAVAPDRLAHSGVLNPAWSFVHAFSVGVALPRDFSIDISYFLFNTLVMRPSAYANPDGVPTDVDGDGAALGDLRRPGQRDSQWFILEVDWHPTSFFTAGVGISTFQPLRLPDGAIASPFFRADRDNHTSIYLSLAVSAESLASAIKNRGSR